MRIIYLALTLVVYTALSASAQQGRYDVYIDLLNVQNDQIQVAITPPRVTAAEAVFVFPATVPGTYEDQMWYRFVRDFKALDADGQVLPMHRTPDSQFVIEQAPRLRRVTYSLEDSFDDRNREIEIFPPAGTCFQRDSVFVLNHAGIVGFIEGYQKLPFKISVNKPYHLFGASATSITQVSGVLDTYEVASYDALIDNPVLYSVPDTATFNVNGVNVLVSLAHPGTDKYAQAYAVNLKKVTMAIAKMLPRMPVTNYAFLFYMWDGDTNKVMRTQSMFGALEHNRSSFYFWGNSPDPSGIDQIAVHEFLHILVPLNVHSEEIETFKFRAPDMSRHLWLYEGVTEYFSYLALVRDSIISEDEFRTTMQQKLQVLDQLPPRFSQTEFSKNVLQPEYAKHYHSVYTYGCANALLLDIRIRKATQGKTGLLDVVYQLMDKFGPSKPFVDKELFDTLETILPESAMDYLNDYVDDTDRIPVEAELSNIGWKYVELDSVNSFTYDFRLARTGLVKETVADAPLPAMKGDELLKINGRILAEVKQTDWYALFDPKGPNPIEVTVMRDGKEVVITGTARPTKKALRHAINVAVPADPAATSLRNSVLYGKTSSL
ncbi:MAG: hypothetical protein SGJ05_00985 [bacterium]|nr:hypothetical protein [bacterium]